MESSSINTNQTFSYISNLTKALSAWNGKAFSKFDELIWFEDRFCLSVRDNKDYKPATDHTFFAHYACQALYHTAKWGNRWIYTICDIEFINSKLKDLCNDFLVKNQRIKFSPLEDLTEQIQKFENKFDELTLLIKTCRTFKAGLSNITVFEGKYNLESINELELGIFNNSLTTLSQFIINEDRTHTCNLINKLTKFIQDQLYINVFTSSENSQDAYDQIHQKRNKSLIDLLNPMQVQKPQKLTVEYFNNFIRGYSHNHALLEEIFKDFKFENCEPLLVFKMIDMLIEKNQHFNSLNLISMLLEKVDLNKKIGVDGVDPNPKSCFIKVLKYQDPNNLLKLLEYFPEKFFCQKEVLEIINQREERNTFEKVRELIKKKIAIFEAVEKSTLLSLSLNDDKSLFMGVPKDIVKNIFAEMINVARFNP